MIKKFFAVFLILAAFSVPAYAEKIGIIGAMDSEVALLKETATIKEIETIAGMDFCSGTLENNDVVIVKCGMGKVNAGICTQILITKFGVSCVINAGIAGALNKTLKIGDVVVAVDCVQHDFDITQFGFAKGEIPYTGRYSFPSDESLRKKAFDAAKANAKNANVIEGRICTGDMFIDTQEKQQAITSNFGGDACEMESGAIAQVCYLNKIPFVILRAISDTAEQVQVEDFSKIEKKTAKLCASITRALIKGGLN